MDENWAEATVLLELTLAESQNIAIASKTLKMLMQMAIMEKDFFGAEHLINRTKQLEIKD